MKKRKFGFFCCRTANALGLDFVPTQSKKILYGEIYIEIISEMNKCFKKK